MRCTIALALALPAAAALADTATIGASKDNTLIEGAGGFLSNGAGSYMFAGVTNQPTGDATRRAILAFDIASAVPAGATINSVSLRLYMSRTNAVGTPMTLHRVLADWGEGQSDAPGGEGGGTIATNGSVTWLYTHYTTQSWTNPGGDFVAAPSASTVVDQAAFYTWSDPGMTADVQAWLNNPSQSFGWILLGDESGPAGTAKRFSTRENSNSSQRPRLVIDYTPIPAPAAVAPVLLAVFAARRRR